MGCSRRFATAGLDTLRSLGREGIAAHVQIVLCPGINDGAVLEQTVDELDRDYPGVSSIGIVPVAVADRLGGNRSGGSVRLRAPSTEECRQVVEDVARWQERFRHLRGYGFVYAADEFYLRGNMPLPDVDDYDDAPQYENGIGIVATFQEEAGEMLRRQLLEVPTGARVFLLTGTLAEEPVAAVLKSLEQSTAGSLADHEFRVLAAENRLFGPHVTVTGLLGGEDVIAAAGSAGAGRSDILLMPAAVMDSAGERFLDGLTFAELSDSLECKAIVV
jgi:NifB/MoaA-like Fe-S oxidoreductase